MHPYCLRLHVNDEAAKWRENHTFFSQEEVWRYERPTEGSDEEINVVSDDEAAAAAKESPERRAESSKLLKSALLKSKASRGRKRVSFGPVEVASFDETLPSGCTAETTPADWPDFPPEVTGNQAETAPPKSPTKTKALSLQQYRQLQRRRLPLVEKQGNYTTKWPSVPEAPQELTPILSSQGHKLSASRPKSPQSSHAAVQSSASARPLPSEASPYTPAKYGKLQHPRTGPKASSPPARPLAGATAGGFVVSPVRRAAVRVSSDPPNPVLLSVPLSQTLSKDQTSSRSNEDPNPAELPPRAIEDAAASSQDAKSSVTIVAPPCPTATHLKGSVPDQQLAGAVHAEIPLERRRPCPAVSGQSSAAPANGNTAAQPAY